MVPRAAYVLIIALLLALFATLAYRAVLTKSATYDETLHAVAGHVVSYYDDYRLDAEDPALFLRFAGLAHDAEELAIDTGDEDFAAVWGDHDRQWTFTVRTLYQTPGNNERDGVKDAVIQDTRAPFVALATLLGALIAWWGWRLGGPVCALTAAALYCLDPNFLAHGALVKNDVPFAFLMLALIVAVWGVGRRATPWRVALLAAAPGVLLGVKFTGIVASLLVPTCLTARALQAGRWEVLGGGLTTRRARLAGALALSLVVALISWVCVWGAYGFRFTETPQGAAGFERKPLLEQTKVKELKVRHRDQPEREITEEEVEAWPESGPVRLIAFLEAHRLMPRAWLYGLWYTYASTLVRGSYLRGAHSDTGWWYFFPLAMLYKTPTATLAALLATLAAWAISARARPWLGSWDWICLLVPVVVYASSALGTNLNIGLRHVLPLYPLLFLLIGLGLARLVEWRPRVGAAIAGALVLGLAAESLPAWPHYIAFFNVPAGGSRGGIELLVDSNLDWGQDLPLLAGWRRRHTDKPLFLSYFGMADPSFYGIGRVDTPDGYPFPLGHEQAWPGTEPAYVAISATNLKGVYAGDDVRRLYAEVFAPKTPLTILGGSIYVYDWRGDEAVITSTPAAGGS